MKIVAGGKLYLRNESVAPHTTSATATTSG